MFKRIIRILLALAIIGLLLVGLGIGALAVLHSRPVALPAPTGEYAVGRIITQWADDTRQETLGGSGGSRRLAVWIWYPAAPSDAAPAPYMPADWSRARIADRGPGSLLFQSPNAIRTHAVEDPPLSAAGAPFPVLIFQPGLGPLVSEYSALAEEMASRGYVVIGLNPTYSASLTILDGAVIPRTDAGTIADSATPGEAQQQGDRLVEVWAADQRFAIDQAERLNAGPASAFFGALDLSHVGLWGHSLGGAAALEACHLDARCTAAADLDGTPFGTVTAGGLDKPVLFEWSEVVDRSDPMIVKADRDVAAIFATVPEGYQVTIHGTRHFNFSDMAIGFNPAGRLLEALGTIDGEEGLRIAGDYLGAFFDHTLRGEESPLLHGSSSPYPEVEFQSGR